MSSARQRLAIAFRAAVAADAKQALGLDLEALKRGQAKRKARKPLEPDEAEALLILALMQKGSRR